MEFGDFGNLPAPEQDIVHRILFSTDASAKDKKRPEVRIIK